MKQTVKLKTNLRATLAARLKIAQLFEMSEENFQELVKKIEQNPIFQKLLLYGVVKRKRIPGIRPIFFSDNFCENFVSTQFQKEFPLPDKSIRKLILKIGEKNFLRFFLTPERAFTAEEISRATGLPEHSIKEIITFMDTFFSHSVFAYETPVFPASQRMSVIAGIEQYNGELHIVDFTLDMSKGEYRIDEDRMIQIKSFLSSVEQKHMYTVFSQLKQINTRRSTIYSLLQILLKKQKDFIVSGKRRDLQILTQSFLSKQVNVHPSVLNRAIKYRTIRLPDGRVVPLRKFFIRHTEKLRVRIQEIIEKYNNRISDAEISRILKQEYGIFIARRTVNYYRHQYSKVRPYQ